MPAYNLAANLLFEYSYFTFESYVVQGLCEIGLALGIEVVHTFREVGLSNVLTRTKQCLL